jgi:hypothetical protein
MRLRRVPQLRDGLTPDGESDSIQTEVTCDSRDRHRVLSVPGRSLGGEHRSVDAASEVYAVTTFNKVHNAGYYVALAKSMAQAAIAHAYSALIRALEEAAETGRCRKSAVALAGSGTTMHTATANLGKNSPGLKERSCHSPLGCHHNSQSPRIISPWRVPDASVSCVFPTEGKDTEGCGRVAAESRTRRIRSTTLDAAATPPWEGSRDAILR